ncbi:MAG: hypothetical protein E7286_05850 [Lachnospiraceae bacterium]|nr:hypothetical protein [Lachnospiraceae bacterium]
MKKIEMFLSVLLSVIFILTSSPVVFAHESENAITEDTSQIEENPVDEEHTEENHTDEESRAARFLCHYCGGNALTVCAGEEDMYGKGYSCSDKDCLVFYYWSTGYYMCTECSRVLVENGLHDCKQIHTGCGKLTFDWCPCDIH